MARKLTTKMTILELRKEVRFTRACLKADPDAADLVPMTNDWTGMVDALRNLEDQVLDAEADSDALFAVANHRLDRSCTRFGNAKLVSLDMDRSSSQFTRYFKVAPSEFIRQPFADEVSAVEGWLTVAGDEVLEAHREDLTTWTGRGREALSEQKAQQQRAADLRLKREELAAALTSSRDALHRTLSDRAEARGLGREWADTFFRKESAPPPKSAETSKNGEAPTSGETSKSTQPASATAEGAASPATTPPPASTAGPQPA